MPTTPVYGYPFEDVNNQPGVSLRAPGPILAEALEDETARIDGDISAVDTRVDVLDGIVAPGVGWTTYIPGVTGQGSATFSTLTGRWRRVGVLTVHVIIYFVVNAAGSGASVVTLGSPPEAPINRATRQMIPCSAEGMSGGGGGNRDGHLVSFTGGATPHVWDRVRIPDGVDSHLDNMTGAMLAAGMTFVAQGTYQEEES